MNQRKLKREIRYYLNMPKFNDEEALMYLDEAIYGKRYEIPIALSRMLLETMVKEFKKKKTNP